MPRNMIIRKDELEVRILKMKNELYDGSGIVKMLTTTMGHNRC